MQTVDFKNFKLQAGDTVLDLGCGEGRHVISTYFEADVQSVGVDLCLDDLRTAKARFHESEELFADQLTGDSGQKSFGLSAANALQLPFADNSFDKVICSEVLEHIPDFRGALKEIERVLKPGGLFCASVPRSWPEKVCWFFSDAYHQNEGGHIRIFEAAKLKAHIEALGFKFYSRHWAHSLHSPFWWLKCMFWKSQDSNWLIRQYHRFLVWDLMDKPPFTRVLEKMLNPLMGKSVVMYFRKETIS